MDFDEGQATESKVALNLCTFQGSQEGTPEGHVPVSLSIQAQAHDTAANLAAQVCTRSPPLPAPAPLSS